MIADVIVDLQFGDCGKGKVANHLCKEGDYSHIIRYNGGCNAGHTIYNNGKKFVTHHIPCGVFHGVKSIIGPGCVIQPDLFAKEMANLKDQGYDVDSLVKIAENAHIITDFHLVQDSTDTKIGTTKRGNGPAYRDKYARKGIRASEIPSLAPYLIDMHDELYKNRNKDLKILFEGAQGFGLDVDWGDYPFVTSSHCTSGGAVLNGVSPRNIRDIWGVAKVYETYVGKRSHEGDDPIFPLIRKFGEEYGATTGRDRQINWMNWDLIERAVNINGVNKIVFNKVDILDTVKRWPLLQDGILYEFESSEDMQFWIKQNLEDSDIDQVFFSGNKDRI